MSDHESTADRAIACGAEARALETIAGQIEALLETFDPGLSDGALLHVMAQGYGALLSSLESRLRDLRAEEISLRRSAGLERLQ